MVMIKIYQAGEQDFKKGSLYNLEPISLIEHKETSLNGWYVEATIGVKDINRVEEGLTAYIETKSKGPQPFIIRDITKTDRYATFKAVHVIYNTENYLLEDVRPTDLSAAGALAWTNSRTDQESPYTTNSDVSNTGTAYFINRSLMYALQTIEERWGGYYDPDHYHINLRNSIGLNRGSTIRYGKNLEGIKVYEDWSQVVTKLKPTGHEGLTLPEAFIYSEVEYDRPYTKSIKFETDLEPDEETNEYDQEALIEELRYKATEYIKANSVPLVSYEVSSNIDEKMELGDTVTVIHPVVGELQTKVIQYEYDVLKKKLNKLVFGNYVRSAKKQIDSIKDAIDKITENNDTFESILKGQSDLINNMNKKGHVYIDDNQIMILDKLPKQEAKNVWRWNLGGLAFSENGVEGPYKLAWTMDGVFNTEFIAANTIMVNHLHSSVGSSLDLSSNESISLIVTNKVEETTSDLKQQVIDSTGRLTVLDDRITSEVTERIELEGKYEEFRNEIEQGSTSWQIDITKKLGDQVSKEDLELLNLYFRVELETGAIIGRQGDPVRVVINNNRIEFQENGIAFAYWEGNTLYVDHIVATITATIGYHEISKYDSPAVGKSTLIQINKEKEAIE